MCRKLKIPINSLAFTQSSVLASFIFKLLDDSVDVDDNMGGGGVVDADATDDDDDDDGGIDLDVDAVEEDEGVDSDNDVGNNVDIDGGVGNDGSDTLDAPCEVCSTEWHACGDWEENIEFWSSAIDEEGKVDSDITNDEEDSVDVGSTGSPVGICFEFNDKQEATSVLDDEDNDDKDCCISIGVGVPGGVRNSCSEEQDESGDKSVELGETEPQDSSEGNLNTWEGKEESDEESDEEDESFFDENDCGGVIGGEHGGWKEIDWIGEESRGNVVKIEYCCCLEDGSWGEEADIDDWGGNEDNALTDLEVDSKWDSKWQGRFSLLSGSDTWINWFNGLMVRTRDLGGATPMVLCGTVKKKKQTAFYGNIIVLVYCNLL